MAKQAVSAKFNKFIEKNLRPGSALDKARKQESMLTGCPLPMDTAGVAVIADLEFAETPEKPDGTGGKLLVRASLEVETPDEYQGKSLKGPGLTWFIASSEKQTEEEAFARCLDDLENMGLPRSVRENFQDLNEIVEHFTGNGPKRVNYSVVKDNWSGNASGKRVRAIKYEEENPNAPTAETPRKPAEAVVEDPNADYAMYMGKKHIIKDFKKDINQYDLEQVDTGRVREGVPGDKVELL